MCILPVLHRHNRWQSTMKGAFPLCNQTGDRWDNLSVRHIACTYQSSVRSLLAGEKIKEIGSHFSLLAHPGHFACNVLPASMDLLSKALHPVK